HRRHRVASSPDASAATRPRRQPRRSGNHPRSRGPARAGGEALMDPNRLTDKAQEVMREAQALAQRHGQSQIEAEHLALALLSQDGGVAVRVVEKADASPATVRQRLQQAVGRLPRVSGPGAPAGQVYVSPRVNDVLNAAETEAQRVKDEFVSVEHL